MLKRHRRISATTCTATVLCSAALALANLTPVAFADRLSNRIPGLRVFASFFGKGVAEVRASREQDEAGECTVVSRLTAIRIGNDGQKKVLWTKNIPFVPVVVHVGEKGQVVSSGSIYESGNRRALVVFDQNGHVVKQFALDELLSEPELREHSYITTRGRVWIHEARFRFVDLGRELELAFTSGYTVRVHLHDGSIIRAAQSTPKPVAGKPAVQPMALDAAERLEQFVDLSTRLEGFRTPDGEVVIPARFEMTWAFSNGLAVVRVSGKWGAIDRDGEFVIPPVYSRLTRFRDGWATGEIFPVHANERPFGHWVLDTDGRVLNKRPLEKAERPSEGCVTGMRGDGQWGIWRPKVGFEPLPGITELGYFQEGRCPAVRDEKLGYINALGDFVIDPIYEHGFNFEHGLTYAFRDGAWYRIDTRGNEEELCQGVKCIDPYARPDGYSYVSEEHIWRRGSGTSCDCAEK